MDAQWEVRFLSEPFGQNPLTALTSSYACLFFRRVCVLFIVVYDSNFLNIGNRVPILFKYFFHYFYISIEGNTRFVYGKLCYESRKWNNLETKVTKKSHLLNSQDWSLWMHFKISINIIKYIALQLIWTIEALNSQHKKTKGHL